ncbi:MAG TPA: Ig-like domain-containing protein [Candidatus Paceibacterota bacterium]|nr:Ig-like domain-containing protein [Candidatus Paceibacterota bacterium]
MERKARKVRSPASGRRARTSASASSSRKRRPAEDSTSGVSPVKRLRARLVGSSGRKISIRDNTRKVEAKEADSTQRVGESEPVAVTKEPTRKEKRTHVRKHALIAHSHVQLALLSPFRFPMLREERFLSTIARHAGVFLVIVGAGLALFNLRYATGYALHETPPSRAQTIDSSFTVTGTGSLDSTAQTNYTAPDPTPGVRLSVEGGGSTLTNMAVIMVTVPYASGVTLLSESAEGHIVTLGAAFMVDATTWRYYWDTKQSPDGPYHLRTVVKNQYGTYEHLDDATYTVKNAIDEKLSAPETDPVTATTNSSGSADAPTSATGETTIATTTVSDTTTVAVPAPVHDITITLGTSPLSAIAPLTVYTKDAKDVRLYARNTASMNLYSLGEAFDHGSGAWRLDWNTLLVPDGDYKIQAKASYQDGTFAESLYMSRSVKNGEVSSLATTTVTSPIEPTVTLRIDAKSPLSGLATIGVEVPGASWVELYAVPKSSLTPLFLGLASRSGDAWTYAWRTQETPNGDYRVYARAKTAYGFVESGKMTVSVQNAVITSYTESQDTLISTLSKAQDSLIKETDGSTTAIAPGAPKPVYIEPVTSFVRTIEASSTVKEAIGDRLAAYRLALNGKLDDLALAIRMGDTARATTIKTEIDALRSSVIVDLSPQVGKKELVADIDKYLSQISFELEELTAKNESILKERIGDAAVKDSDKDGITDYDEVNLYKTNPFAADTDGDSFIDSAEIRNGFDPNDSESQSLIAYESPKDSGTKRPDLLAVDSITTLTATTRSGSGLPKKALISGRGLPNSYVTLFIYSTPVVVTVKTDAEGAWSYVFDKELDDGTHEVYVGITDNAGRVVAKSDPLPFVKTAEAYTGSVTVAPAPAPADTSFVDERTLLLVASMAVVGLGLVLMLLGYHVRGRREDSVTAAT